MTNTQRIAATLAVIDLLIQSIAQNDREKQMQYLQQAIEARKAMDG